MADRYVYSGAAGTGTGADWTNAHTTLSAAITASTAGDRFFVAHDHVQTQASALTLGFKGSAGATTVMDLVYCVNRAGSVPPVSTDLRTTAQVTTTGNFAITITGSHRMYGIIFSCGNGTASASLTTGGDGNLQNYEQCTFKLGGTGAQKLIIGNSRSWIKWKDCVTQFGATTQAIFPGSRMEIDGPYSTPFITGATIPTTLFLPSSPPISNPYEMLIRNCDLSASGSGKNIYNDSNSAQSSHLRFLNCKLNASVTQLTVAGSVNMGMPGAFFLGCGSAAADVKQNNFYQPMLFITSEFTIVRTAGSVDVYGNPYSWKYAPQAGNRWDFPIDCFEGVIFNSVTGSARTLTVHCVTNNVQLTNKDLWLEVDYLGDSGSPLMSRVSSDPADPLAAAANLTSDSGEAWTTTGIATPLKQNTSVTFTPLLAGPIRFRVRFGKASTTTYVCAKADLS